MPRKKKVDTEEEETTNEEAVVEEGLESEEAVVEEAVEVEEDEEDEEAVETVAPTIDEDGNEVLAEDDIPIDDSDKPVTMAPVDHAAAAPFLASLIKAAQKFTGSTTRIVGTEGEVVGLEPYALTMQYVMDIQVIPMQSIITISGKPKTKKTSAILEFCRTAIVNDPPGIGAVVHTEGKWSNTLARSFMREHAEALIISPAKSVQEWQCTATGLLKATQDAINKKREARAKRQKGSEYYNMLITPLMIGIDSLTGSQSTAIQEKILGDGHGAKTYNDRAQLIWQWLATWSSNILGIPATVVISQHLQDKIGGMARPGQQVTPGGHGPTYHTSMEIRVDRVKEIDTANKRGLLLQWKNVHNSLGMDRKKIIVPHYYDWDVEGQQISWYDWDDSLTTLLMTIFTTGSAAFKKRIRDVTGAIVAYPKKGGGKVYSCETLKITKAKAIADNITATALGRLLQQPGSDIRTALRKALRIKDCTIWTPDTVL